MDVQLALVPAGRGARHRADRGHSGLVLVGAGVDNTPSGCWPMSCPVRPPGRRPALKSATAAWQSLLRSSDLLARCGGEEFAVLLPSSTLGQAVEVVSRLPAATPLAQTFSAGVPLWHGDETSDQLVARADQAL
jgi:hypothetical protein